MKHPKAEPLHPKINANYWWASVHDSFEKVMREFLKRAKDGDLRERGHDCGHEFTFRVTTRGHHIGPDGQHGNSNYSEEMEPVTVRAHNLRDALLLAAAEPLSSWFPADDDDEEEDK